MTVLTDKELYDLYKGKNEWTTAEVDLAYHNYSYMSDTDHENAIEIKAKRPINTIITYTKWENNIPVKVEKWEKMGTNHWQSI